jgi:transposase
MDLYIGFDVSLASSAMCGLSENGKLVKEATCPTEPEELVKALNALPGRVVAVGLEAGPLSQWLYQHLTEAGFPTVLMETRQVKGALKAMPIKTDRRDAEGIARLLQMGWFRSVHCKSLSAQEMRALLSSRKAIQQATLSLELSIRGVLRNFGLKMGQVAKGRFEQRVLELTEGNPMLEAAATPILSARRALRQELAGIEKLLRDHAKSDPVCRQLMTMPGVGALVALTYKAAIDDPDRFLSSRDVGPWVGLTPRREQSGERDIIGEISRAGDAGLRTALYQAATVMLNTARPNWLSGWAWNVAKRRGKKRATVALARRIGVVLHRMWQDGTEFRFTRADTTTAAAA